MGSVLSKLCLATAAATCLLVPPGIHALARSSRSSPTELMKAVMHLEDDIARILKKHSRHHGVLAAEEEELCDAVLKKYGIDPEAEVLFALSHSLPLPLPKQLQDANKMKLAKAEYEQCSYNELQAWLCKERPPLDPADVARFNAMAEAEDLKHAAVIAETRIKDMRKENQGVVDPAVKKFMDDNRLALLKKIHTKALTVLRDAEIAEIVQKTEGIYGAIFTSPVDFKNHEEAEEKLEKGMKAAILDLTERAAAAKKDLASMRGEVGIDSDPARDQQLAVTYEKVQSAANFLVGLYETQEKVYTALAAAARSETVAAYQTVEAQTVEAAVAATGVIPTLEAAVDDAKPDGVAADVSDFNEVENCDEVITSKPLVDLPVIHVAPVEKVKKRRLMKLWRFFKEEIE